MGDFFKKLGNVALALAALILLWVVGYGVYDLVRWIASKI